MKVTFICLVFCLCQVPKVFTDKLDDKYGEVIFVNILFRHGDRTPIKTYPNDPYKDRNKWPVDWGQLTDLGVAHHYQLGKWFRKQYAHLFTERYDPKIINIQSTDVDRTLMSAQSNLAGMFYPTPIHLPLQPVPIHTIPEEMDKLLAMKMPCKKYEIEYDQFKRSTTMANEHKRYDKLIRYLEKNTGDKIDITKMEYLYSTLFIESAYFKLPKWTDGIMPQLREAAGLCFQIPTYTPILKRLRSGPLIKKMLELMHDKWRLKDSFTRNIQVFSAHDTTVAGLLNSMNIFDGLPPPFASSVMVELRAKDGHPLVTIRYKKDVNDTEPLVLIVPGCLVEGCPLPRLTNLLKSVIPHDWTAECHDHTAFDMSLDQPYDTLAIFAMLTMTLIAFVLLVSLSIYWHKKKPTHIYKKLKIETI